MWTHTHRRWPAADPFTQCAKVTEEAAEVIGAAIAKRIGRCTEQDVLDELADTVVSAIGAIQARGHDPRHVRDLDNPAAAPLSADQFGGSRPSTTTFASSSTAAASSSRSRLPSPGKPA